MPKHDFGIMQKNPPVRKRFDSYEPDKYNCISVDHDCIEPILEEFDEICYWHTLKRPEKGLAGSGVTLIPPSAMDGLIVILSHQNRQEFSSLISLLEDAISGEKFIIHFGI